MFYTVWGAPQVLVTCHLGLKGCGNQLLSVLFGGNEHLKGLSNFDVAGIGFAGEQHPLGGGVWARNTALF